MECNNLKVCASVPLCNTTMNYGLFVRIKKRAKERESKECEYQNANKYLPFFANSLETC